jgi:hypothetical protein
LVFQLLKGCLSHSKFSSLFIAIQFLLLPFGTSATTLYLSHGGAGNETLGGVVFSNSDVVRFDTEAGLALKVFDGNAFFADNENVVGIDLLENEHLLITTPSAASLSGGTANFKRGDLIEVDISGATPSVVGVVFSSASLYGSTKTLSGIDTHPTAMWLASATRPTTANSISLDVGDIVQFDPVTPSTTVSLYLDADAVFRSTVLINAISVLSETSSRSLPILIKC